VFSLCKTSICKKVDDKNQLSNIINNTSISQIKIISAQTVEDSENNNVNGKIALYSIVHVPTS
jgi:hypothetical protein